MQIFNEPEYLSVQDYADALAKYVERVSSLRNVVSVYTMGSVRAPGLSDLDVIVVVGDQFHPRNSRKISTYGIDDRLFIHGPAVIPWSQASNLQYIIYASDLKLIHGTPALSEFSELPENVSVILKKCYLIDFVEGRLSQFARAIAKRKLDKRAWIARLWSITHTERIATSLGVPLSNAVRARIRKIEKLRDSWLRGYGINNSDFIDAFWGGKRANEEIFATAINAFYKGSPLCKDSVSIKNKRIFFRSDCDRPQYEARIADFMGRHLFGLRCVQMIPYAEHLRLYGRLEKEDHCVSEFDDDARVMWERHNIVASHARWVMEQAPHSGSMTGYLGFESVRSQRLMGKFKDVAGYMLASM